jgi:ankyrin repeat protein
VRDLLEAGANVGVRDTRGLCPLFAAVRNRSPKGSIIDLLVANRVDPNMTDKNGWCAIKWAVIYNNTDVLTTLIRYGVNVNTRDKTGKTPLMVACQIGSIPTVDNLLKAGADLHMLDQRKRNAKTYACLHKTQSKQIAQLLANHSKITTI